MCVCNVSVIVCVLNGAGVLRFDVVRSRPSAVLILFGCFCFAIGRGGFYAWTREALSEWARGIKYISAWVDPHRAGVLLS